MASKPKAGEPFTIGTGPFRGVNATVNPMDDTPDLLTDALNGYFPDPINGSEFAARPPFVMTAAPASAMLGAGPVVQVESAGVLYTFAVMKDSGGTTRLYRTTSAGTPVWTDVSPVGITMTLTSAGGGAGLFSLLEFNGQLIVTDSVNQPWIGTALSSTPITGTLIPIDAANDAWTTIGKPTVYVDSLFFICATTVSNAIGGICLVWCEPNQPLVGYMQSGFADFWNILQTGTRPLYCIQGTNSGLYYSRETSWGVLAGVPSVNFSTTATNDTVSYNVGCVGAQTVQVFGNYIYFCDAIGRPWRMAIGGVPEPIWLRMRQFVDAALSAGTGTGLGALPVSVQTFAFAVIEPTTNAYICFPWAVFFSFPPAGYIPAPAEGHRFDAVTGTYQGRWNVGGGTRLLGGCIVLPDAGSPPTMLVMAAIPGTPINAGQTWVLQPMSTASWSDSGASTTSILAQSPRLGYSASTQLRLGKVRAVTNNQTPVAMTAIGTNGTVGPYTSTPPASGDQTNLAQWRSVSTQGRGFLLQFVPTTTTSQWRLFHAECEVVGAEVQASDA